MSKLSISLSLTNPPRRIPIEVESDATSKDLFDAASQATNIPMGGMKLIFRGRIITNKGDGDEVSVVEEFKLEPGCVIHCMGKPSPSATAAATSTAASATSAGSSVAATSSGSTVTVPSAAPAATSTSTSPPSTGNADLSAALLTIKTNHPGNEYKTALTTLSKLLQNVIQNPMEEKYRKVKKTNAAFQKRLGRLTGAEQAIYAIGFRTVGEEYVLVPSPEAWPSLLQASSTIEQAVRDHNAAVSASTTPFNTAAAATGGNMDMGFGGIPNMGAGAPPAAGAGAGMNFPPAGGMPPGVSELLSNPQALQAMLQDPMVQQMMQNHPQFANNPMMQQQMSMLANNPQMMQQMSRMMSDPNMISRMQQMMQGGGMGGMGAAGAGAGGGMDMNRQMELMRQFANFNSGTTANNSNAGTGSTSTPNSGANTNATQNNSNGGNNNNGDGEMTEEEMIEAAIARSLREQ